MRTRASGFLAALAVAIVTAFTIVPWLADAGPSSHTQPLLDGCQRSDSLTLAVSTPEWVYVHANQVLAAKLAGDVAAGRRSAEGVVAESRPAGEDLYLTHDFGDYNVTMTPDPAYAGLLGSGNLVPGREQGMIEAEWETGAIPRWAWASPGDRVRLSGNWIWDCGHWGNSAADPTGLSQLLVYDPIETAKDLRAPGAIRGEQTELHPLYEIATSRANAAADLQGAGPRTVTRLDAWINGDGTPAHQVEDCALRAIVNAVFARALCPKARDVGGTYTYTMRLGPKPSAASRLIVNPLIVRPETSPSLAATPVSVVPDASQGTVMVSFTLPHAAAPQRYGLTAIAGWSDAPAAIHHRVTLDKIHIIRSLDGASEPNLNPFGVAGEQTPDPGEWVLYANVSGTWVQIPHIAGVRDGQDIPIGETIDLYLPPGVTPTLYVSGHECDEPLFDCVHEGTGLPANTLAQHELGFNDHPGRIQTGRLGVALSAGTADYRPPPNPDLHSGFEDLSDAICGPESCYRLTVTWVTP